MALISLYLIGILISLIGKSSLIALNVIFFIIFLYSVLYKTIKQIVESVSSPNRNSLRR